MKWIFILIMPFLLSACPKEVPVFNKDVYIGDSSQQALVRKQGGQVIKASDPKFDQMVSVSRDDFACLLETFLVNCERFKKQSECGLQPSQP